MTAHEWVWFGVDDDGKHHSSLGRWQKHPCQMRYKLAEIQPTEHDHALPAAPAEDVRAGALKEAAAVAEACERQNYRRVTDSEHQGHYRAGLRSAAQAIRAAILARIPEARP